MLMRILRHLRRRFIDAPRGLGHPVPAAAFDAEFRSGHWSLLDSTDEQARYTALAAQILRHSPKPKLLDAGCGSGRLAACFARDELTCYHGVDLSTEAIALAQKHAPLGASFEQADLELWTPIHRYDVLVLNEVIGYFRDPAATLTRLTPALEPGGIFAVSLYRWGNAPAIWRRIDTLFATTHATVVTNPNSDKMWDVRMLSPITAAALRRP